jgi:Carboxypeptidase regulatory-like domain
MKWLLEVVSRDRGARCKNAAQILGAIFTVLLACVPGFSQGSYGRILGTVTDQSGGVVSGATVTVIDTERGISRTLTTDDAGAYNAPNLTPGNYTVRGEAKGFKRIERLGVVIEVGHEVRVDLTVQPGEQNQTVTVTESVPLVETTNATMGGTLENADIVDLPLNGRDYQNLLGLRPGVMLQPGGGPWTQSTNGVRPDESVWLVEGIINENFFDARPVINMPSPFTDGATIMPVDAIQEFNLMENPKAEYGWKAGAQVNVGIKSGTNSLHGDAYAFGRYQNWDARNYFNISNPAGCSPALLQADGTCPQTAAQLKQFGGVVGGPIKKDKLFFFAGYEGLRSFIGFVGGINVPATASQGGQPGSSMVDAIQALQAAGVPRSGVSEKLTGCTEPTPITATCTGGLLPNTGASNSFLSTFPTTNTSDNGVGKLDYRPNDKNSINGMFFYGHYTAPGEDHPFTNQAFTDNAPIRTTSITSSWVYTPSSTVVNEARFGYDRITFDFVNLDVNTPADGTGYPINTGVNNALVGGMPSIRIAPYGLGGTQVFGTATNRPQYFTPNPYWDAQDSISVLKGKHSIKIGGEFAHMEADSQVFNNGRGTFLFAGGNLLGGASTGLEDFFGGAPTNGKLLTGTPLSKLTDMMFAGFIQDDWRITPKVIINLGLRYMYLTPLKDANGNFGNFDPTSATGLVQQGQAGFSTIFNPDPHDFEPRFGMAWDVKGNGNTVVRLGVGLLHEVWVMETFEGQFQLQNNNATSPNATPTGATFICGANNCPSSGGGTIALGSATFPTGSLCWDPALPSCPAGQSTVFPSSGAGISCGDGVTVPAGKPNAGQSAAPCDLMGVDPNLKLPYVLNYNLGVTHAFGSNFSLEVEYVGNHGYRLLNFADINQGTPGSAYCMGSLTAAQFADACGPNRVVGVGTGTPGTPCVIGLSFGATGFCSANPQAVQESRPYYSKFPYIGFINYVTNRSYSNYNSIQVTLTKRMSHGLLFNVGYTYGHGLDAGSLNRFGLNPQNSVNPAAGEYGNSDFDVRHRLTATATYNIPGKKGFGQMLEGWQLNTIVTFATSQPWQTFDPADNFSGTNENADRWDIFGNPADFPSGKNSIPYCTAAGCTYNSIYGTFPTLSPAAFSKCQAVAPDQNTLNAAGCYVSTNGNSVIVPPALGTFGNMGRNVLRDNGFKNWDMSIFKNWTFKERYGIQARWEVFNVLNHPIAANPYGASSAVQTGNNPTAGGGGFGASLLTPDFAAGNPLIGSGSQRVMQVGLKLSF